MSKELDEFYKSYSARIIAIDDTPSVEVMDGDKFKLLSIEEYEEITNKIADLQSQLAESESKRKSLEEKIKFLTEETEENFGYDSDYDLKAITEQYKQQAKEMLEDE